MIEFSDDDMKATSLNDLKIWKNLQFNNQWRFLISESRKEAYWFEERDPYHPES